MKHYAANHLIARSRAVTAKSITAEVYQHTSQFLNGLSSTLKRHSEGLADLSNTTDRKMTLYAEHNDRDVKYRRES